MEYGFGATIVWQFFPGEMPSGGLGTSGPNGLKGPVAIPEDYHSHPELYGYPEEPTPWGYAEERRASPALYDYRLLPADDQPSDGRLLARAPRSWRDGLIFDPTDPTPPVAAVGAVIFKNESVKAAGMFSESVAAAGMFGEAVN